MKNTMKLIVVLAPQQYQSGVNYLLPSTVSHFVDSKTGRRFTIDKGRTPESIGAKYDRDRKQYMIEITESELKFLQEPLMKKIRERMERA